MNKTIKQLWDNSIEEFSKQHQYATIMLPEPLREKFAELIVRECAEQSMSIGRYNTPSGITPDLAIAIAVGLKKHFGVEELQQTIDFETQDPETAKGTKVEQFGVEE